MMRPLAGRLLKRKPETSGLGVRRLYGRHSPWAKAEPDSIQADGRTVAGRLTCILYRRNVVARLGGKQGAAFGSYAAITR
jgi:hypothetical protein